MFEIPIILLSAGSSSRMGEPKQLLAYQGKTLLQHALDTAISATSGPVIVVLGAFYEKILPTLAADTLVVKNENWEQGMASSLHIGLRYVLTHYSNAKACLCMLCDQPLITPVHLELLLNTWENGEKGIVATKYSDIQGVPVVFGREYFDKLLQTEGSAGARKLIQKYLYDVEAVLFESAAFDVDTPEAYRKLLNRN